MNNFDIICTATLRPELLKETFDTHIKYLFKDSIKKANLILNVDMIGSDNPDKAFDRIIKYIDTIPFNTITLKQGFVPHFSRAFCWALGEIQSDLVFNLEEDWKLNKDIDFKRMVQLFEEQSNLAHLRLSQFKSTQEDTIKVWNKFIPWNGDYFEVQQDLKGTIGWAGHPSINRSSFLLAFKKIIDPERNHEKQIKGNHPLILKSRFGVFHPKNSLAAITDTGRAWMVKHGYRKQGAKAFFTVWEEA